MNLDQLIEETCIGLAKKINPSMLMEWNRPDWEFDKARWKEVLRPAFEKMKAEIVEKVSDRVDHAIRKGNISTYDDVVTIVTDAAG